MLSCLLVELEVVDMEDFTDNQDSMVSVIQKVYAKQRQLTVTL